MRGIILRLTDQNGIFHRIYILAPSKSPNSQHGLFPLIYDSLLSKGASPRSVWNAICSRHLMIFDSLVFKLIGSGSCFISLLLRMLSKVLGAPNLPDRTCRNIERHVRLCQACVAAACRDNDYPTFSSSLPFFNLGIIYITILRFEKITLLAWIGMGDQSASCAAHCALNWNSEKFGVFLDHHNNEPTGKTFSEAIQWNLWEKIDPEVQCSKATALSSTEASWNFGIWSLGCGAKVSACTVVSSSWKLFSWSVRTNYCC